MVSTLRQAFSSQGVEVVAGRDFDSLRSEILKNEAFQGIVVIDGDITQIDSFTYYSRSGTDFMYSQMIAGIIGDIALEQRLAKAGYSPQEFQELSRVPSVTVRKITGDGDTEGEDIFTVIITSIAFIMLLYMSTLLYGQMIGRSVVVEKTSRTVELLLSSSRPGEILAERFWGSAVPASCSI